jgi:hypothetical protein
MVYCRFNERYRGVHLAIIHFPFHDGPSIGCLVASLSLLEYVLFSTPLEKSLNLKEKSKPTTFLFFETVYIVLRLK